MFGFLKRRESRRINELLTANNAYLQRARDAESECDALRAANAEMCADLDARDFTIDTLAEVFEAKDRMISDMAMSVAMMRADRDSLIREARRWHVLHNKVAARLSDSRKKRQAVENRLWLQEEVNRNLSKELCERPAISPEAASLLGIRKPGPWDFSEGGLLREAA